MVVVGVYYVLYGVILLLWNSVLGERLYECFCGFDV